MKPTVQQLNDINRICKSLNLDPHVYQNVEEPGKLIFDLAKISILKRGLLSAGKILPPDPKNYMGAKK